MKRYREIIVGIVVLAALAVFYFGYNYLKGTDVFTQREYYYAVYDKIEGLSPNAPVQVNGFTVGRVASTDLHPDMSGRVVVQFTVENDKFHFPKNATARIMSTDLLGSRAIQLVVPEVKTGVAMPGDTINSGVEEDIGAQVQAELEPFKAKLNDMMSEIDTVIQAVQLMFNEDASKALNASFDAIVAGFQTFELTAHEIDSLIREERGKIAHIIYNVDEITTTLEQNKADLDNFMNNMSTLSDTLAAVEIAQTVDNANMALAELSELLIQINSSEGTLGLLMHDPELYNNLTQSAADLSSLLADLETNPHRYLHIAAFDLHRERPHDKAARKAARQAKRDAKRNRGQNGSSSTPNNEPDSIP